jgi:hypothetical protein
MYGIRQHRRRQSLHMSQWLQYHRRRHRQQQLNNQQLLM